MAYNGIHSTFQPQVLADHIERDQLNGFLQSISDSFFVYTHSSGPFVLSLFILLCSFDIWVPMGLQAPLEHYVEVPVKVTPLPDLLYL